MNTTHKSTDKSSQGARPNRKGGKFFAFRKRSCTLCDNAVIWLDYKNVEFVKGYISKRGKILPSKLTGFCNKHQRQFSSSVKILRNLALLPYTTVKHDFIINR